MSLYKRGDTWHYDFAVNGQRHRGSTGLRSKTAAREVEQARKREAALGTLGREVPTLEQVASAWFAANVAGKKSQKTTAQRLEITLRLMGAGTRISHIGAPEIAAAIAVRRTETTRQKRLPTNATVNRDLIDTTLRPILRYAEEVMEVPVRKIPWTKLKLTEPKERDRPYTPDELTRWRAGLPPWHQPVFDFMMKYGVRLREAFFPLTSFDPVSGRVYLRERKGGKQHVIRIQEDDRRRLAAMAGRARAAKLKTLWFREMKSGELRSIRWRGFQSASRKALDGAEIADARPAHDLRHHAASTLLRQTGNLAVVKRLLGHEQIQSTMRYARSDEEAVFEAMRHAYATSAENEVEGESEKSMESKDKQAI